MTTLVTGASGFVGTWLTQRLAARGAPVVAQMRRAPDGLFARLGLDRAEGVRVVADPDCAAVLAEVRPGTVFHLAGMSQIRAVLDQPALAFEANTRETWRLLEACRSLDPAPKVVVASTDSVYGEAHGRASSEDDPMNAGGPYELSKQFADRIAQSYAGLFGLPVTVARLGNVYGYGDANTARIIPSVMAAVARGDRPQLRGGGRAVRALLYIDDCLDGLEALAGAADRDGVRGQAFNLSGGPPMTILQIAKAVLRATGREDLAPEIFDDGVQETSDKHSSIARIEAALGWRPAVTLDDGLARICEMAGKETT